MIILFRTDYDYKPIMPDSDFN